MKSNNKTIGILLIASAIALLIPYTILTIIFEYPVILRQDTGTILTKFYQGGNSLIWTWFAFAITGIPLLPAYIMIGQKFETKAPFVRMATTIGVIGLIVQMIGLLRWTFVVPVLADTFVHAADEATKAAAIVSFKTIHQFGGVILGEHLGQLTHTAIYALGDVLPDVRALHGSSVSSGEAGGALTTLIIAFRYLSC